MEPTWYVGNADDDSGENRSWLVGHFRDPGDIRHSKDTEVKWAHHPEGDARTEWSPGVHAGTVLVLVSGRWQLHLRRNGEVESVVLERPGDYVVWGPGVDHTWQALAESVMVTVRWPSSLSADDQATSCRTCL